MVDLGLGERKTQKERKRVEMQLAEKETETISARFVDRIASNIMEHSLCDSFKAKATSTPNSAD